MLLNNLFSNGLNGNPIAENVFDFTCTEGQVDFPVPHGGYNVTVSANGVTLHGPDLDLTDLTKVALLTPRTAGDLIRIVLSSSAVAGTGGIAVGQLVSGFFAGDPKYVPAEGGRFLLAAYPDVAPLIANGGLSTYIEPTATKEQVFSGILSTTVWKELRTFVDDDVIFCPQQPSSSVTGIGYLMSVSVDGGATWKGVLPRAGFSTQATPEAAAKGFTYTATAIILGIVKLDAPGHYSALITHSSTSGNIYLITTKDYGTTWTGYGEVQASTSISNALSFNLFYRNGVYLYVQSGVAKYSVDGGLNWISLSNAVWALGTAGTYIQLSSDGYLVWAGNNTSQYYLQWPELPSGWSPTIAVTTVASKFPSSVMYVKKLGDYWFAYSSSTTTLLISTSMLGTYTGSALAGITSLQDVQHANGILYITANTSTGRALYYAPIGSTVTAITPIDNSFTPAFQNTNVNARWPLTHSRFALMIGAAERIMFRHGREAIAEIVAPTGANNIVEINGDTPSAQNPLFCYKYGMWFCSIPKNTNLVVETPLNSVDVDRFVGHYRSVDGMNWIPIGQGMSGIIDAGTRLLRLTAIATLEQSTDGVVWDTVGITQPTIAAAGSVGAARLWRCGEMVYYYTGPNVNSGASSNFYGSSDGGLVWTRIAGTITAPGAVAKVSGAVAFYRGKYFMLSCYNSNSPQTLTEGSIDYSSICVSSDGITFSTLTTTGFTAGAWYPQKAGVFVLNDRLFVMTGAMSSNNQILPYVTSDGKTLFLVNQATVTSEWRSAAAVGFDNSNGDGRWYIDRQLTVGSSVVRELTIYVNGVKENSAIFTYSLYAAILGCFAGDGNGSYLAANLLGSFKYTPESVSFLVPKPNAGTSPMPYPFMRVAN